MKPVNAIKAVLRATGQGSVDAVRAHVPLDFSTASNSSMSSNHGAVWENDITTRDTSCVIELRNLYRSAAEAQDVAVRLTIVPCGAYSFPTQCIVSVGGSYAKTEAELVKEGGKDIVLREWDLDRSQLLSRHPAPFELELPLRAIMNIASLVAPPVSSRDPPVCRIFLGLRFVGCCDASRQHKIKQITAEYMVMRGSNNSVEVSAFSPDNAPRMTNVSIRQPSQSRVEMSDSRQRSRSPAAAADSDTSIEIYVDDGNSQWEPNIKVTHLSKGSSRPSAAPPPQQQHDDIMELDINTPASRRHPSASPSVSRPRETSQVQHQWTTSRAGSAMEEYGAEVESTPVSCAPVNIPKTPVIAAEYRTKTNPPPAWMNAHNSADVPFAATQPSSSSIPQKQNHAEPIPTPARPAAPKQRPPPVEPLTPSRMHTVVAMSPAGVVDSPRRRDDHCDDEDDHDAASRFHHSGATSISAFQHASQTAYSLHQDPTEGSDESTASLATFHSVAQRQQQQQQQQHRSQQQQSSPLPAYHDFDASPIPTLGSDSRTRAAVLPGMILQAELQSKTRNAAAPQRQRVSVQESATNDSAAARSSGVAAGEAETSDVRSRSPSVVHLHALSQQLASLVTEVRALSNKREGSVEATPQTSTTAPPTTMPPPTAATKPSPMFIESLPYPSSRPPSPAPTSSSRSVSPAVFMDHHYPGAGAPAMMDPPSRATSLAAQASYGMVHSAPPSRTSSPFRHIRTPSQSTPSCEPTPSPLQTTTPSIPQQSQIRASTPSEEHHTAPISKRSSSFGSVVDTEPIRVTPVLVPPKTNFVPLVSQRARRCDSAEVAADSLVSSHLQHGLNGPRRSRSCDAASSSARASETAIVSSQLMLLPSRPVSNNASVLLNEVEAVIGKLQPSRSVPVAAQDVRPSRQLAPPALTQGSLLPRQVSAAPVLAAPERAVEVPHWSTMTTVSSQTPVRSSSSAAPPRFSVVAQPTPLAARDHNAPVRACAPAQTSTTGRPPIPPPPTQVMQPTSPNTVDNVVVAWCEKHHKTRSSTARRVLAIAQGSAATPGCTIYLNKKDGTAWAAQGEKPGCELLKGEVTVTVGLRAFMDHTAIHQRDVASPERCIVFREHPSIGNGSEALILGIEICTDEDFSRVVAILERSLGPARR